MGDAAPQSTVLVSVHLIEGSLVAGAHQPFLNIVLHHLLHFLQTQIIADLILRQQHSEQQEHLLVCGVLMVAVAIKNEGGAWRQLFEAVDDSHGFVSFEGCFQLAVNVQLHLIAVLAGFAGSIDVEDGGIEGRREGGGQAVSQAAQRFLSPLTSSKDQADWLCGLGCFEVLLQMDLAPPPQLRPLTREASLKKRQLICKIF